MSLKQEIETWVAALAAYDNNEFDVSLKSFELIADTSKILFNCGVIHATLGEHETAVEFYGRAIKLDQYLAVAYFQQGVSHFLVGDFEEALANFNDTLLYLRGNNNIDYEQLGLQFKLYSCEVLFNRGLCYIYLQQLDAGMQDLQFAAKEKVVPDHDVIDEAIREQAEGYTVFSIPVGIVYRPNEAKVKNLKAKDYLGKARLVAATDRSNTFTGFQGIELKNRSTGAMNKDDRPEENKSFAAANLVKTDLVSRSRQQSEPPMSRNVFPPTPPPEQDSRPPPSEERKPSMTARADSVRSGPKPRPLDLSVAGFEKPRMGTVRSASERPRGNRDRESDRRGPPRKRMTDDYDDGGYDDMLDMYGATGGGPRRSKNGPSRMRETYIDEEAEDDYYGDGYSEPDFEMVNSRRSQGYSRGQRGPPSRSNTTMSYSPSERGDALKKIRVKVHADDVRYVMIGPAVEFRDFVDQIRIKFGLRAAFKIKIRDDDDFITMGDQDDLDMAIQMSREETRRGGMGKMEVWLQEV